MINSEEQVHPFFEPDEYTAINIRYFEQMRRTGRVQMDPSGWIETQSEAAKLVLPPMRALPLGRYYMDEGDALGNLRSELHQLLSAWDGLPFDAERFTACPSVGVASFLSMAVLRRRGIERMIFETPCYFAAILQAEWLGYDVVLIPTYRRDGYERPPDYVQAAGKTPSAWWLTQPRVTLGIDQEAESLRTLIQEVGRRDYVVVDEALDQSFPSRFGQLHHSWPMAQKVIRLKGFGKPLGLNSYRLAFALHYADLRADFVDCLETFAGAIDGHSLQAACAVAAEPNRLAMMMHVANQQVVALRSVAEKLVAGSAVAVNPLVNGYLGSAVVDLTRLGRDQTTRRHRFLLGCQERGMPVIIGPSMHFASDPPSEAVRLNFFSKREHVLRGVTALAEIADTVI